MNKWLTKKSVLMIGLVGTVAFIYTYSQPPQPVYGEFGYRFDLMEYISRWTVFFVPLFLLTLFSSIMKSEVYKVWEKITLYAFIVYVVLLVFLPEPNGNISILPTPSDTAYYVSLIYFIASLILIAYKSYKLKGK